MYEVEYGLVLSDVLCVDEGEILSIFINMVIDIGEVIFVEESGLVVGVIIWVDILRIVIEGIEVL